MGVNKRLKALEDKVLGPIEPGSSKLHLFQPVVSEAEELFFQRVYNIADAYRGTDKLPSLEEMELLQQGVNRIFKRAIDLFESCMKMWFDIEDSQQGKFLWTVRFWYFMMEFSRHVKQFKAEEAIGRENKSWKKYERAWKEYEATLTDEERIPLWSDESFKHFMDAYIFRSPEEIRARRRQLKKKEKVTA